MVELLICGGIYFNLLIIPHIVFDALLFLLSFQILFIIGNRLGYTIFGCRSFTGKVMLRPKVTNLPFALFIIHTNFGFRA